MGISHLNMEAIVAEVTLLACLGIFGKTNVGAKPSRIIDGSDVTFFYEITVPDETGFEVRNIGKFVQGRHQLPQAFERVVSGMKAGAEKKIDLSAEEGFDPYDVKKRKTVPKSDLPAGTKEGDILADRAGRKALVIQLSERSAVMDYNHPLAGKPMSMKIRILRVDDPS
ncbi:MAG: FKBP-type peptidyl-prolyl cis-trans isomerase [Nitrospiraceae bacterium]